MRKFLGLFFLAGLLGGCNGTPPPPPICPDGQVWNGVSCVCPDGLEWVEGEGVCLPPRVDSPPDPKRILGITAFALPLHSRSYITEVANYAKSKGYNTLRVGFETWRWNGSLSFRFAHAGDIDYGDYDTGKMLASRGYLPMGPKFDSEENLENVRRMLDATARIPGVWVELIPVFTIKGLDDPDTPEMRREAVRLAAKLVVENDFKHVFFSYANEWRRSGGVGEKISKAEVVEGLRELRKTGRLVTTDCPGSDTENGWDPSYEKDFLPHVDMVAFHPRRNPEPGPWQLGLGFSRYVVREGKLACLYNETVSFASDEELKLYPHLVGSFLTANMGRPPESKRKQIIVEYKDRIEDSGCRWYYHCIACFMGSTEFAPFWIPEI